MTIFSSAFWAYAGNRAARSFAQAVVLLAGVQVQPLDVLHAPWLTIFELSLGMAFLSVCTSVIAYTAPTAPPPDALATQPLSPLPGEGFVHHGEHEAP